MNFLKKATTQVRAKVTKYEISNDDEFDRLQESYKNSKKNTSQIEKHLKMLTQHVKGVADSLNHLTEDFAQEYESSDVMRQHISQIHQLAQQFQKGPVEEFESAIMNRSVSHVKNFSASLDGASRAIDSRDKAKYSFDNSRYKVVQMLESKKPVDQFKFKSAQQDLATDTATYNSAAYQCKKELYELTHARAHNPALSALCESVASLSQNMAHTLSQLSSISQQINQVGVYQEKYPQNKETVRPAELNLQPQSGFGNGGGASSAPSQPQQQSFYPSSAPSAASSGVPSEFDSEWYYLDANVQQQGPISFQDLKSMFHSNRITASTHVFGGSLTDWAPLGSVNGLMSALNK